MEARSESQHRTKVNPCAGSFVWVSMLRNATPYIRSRQGCIGGGSGEKFCVLTLGDLLGSATGGRPGSDAGTMSGQKSDHLIVAMKPGNVGGAKGVTG
jgi:hypothetical protein